MDKISLKEQTLFWYNKSCDYYGDGDYGEARKHAREALDCCRELQRNRSGEEDFSDLLDAVRAQSEKCNAAYDANFF